MLNDRSLAPTFIAEISAISLSNQGGQVLLRKMERTRFIMHFLQRLPDCMFYTWPSFRSPIRPFSCSSLSRGPNSLDIVSPYQHRAVKKFVLTNELQPNRVLPRKGIIKNNSTADEDAAR